MNDYRQEEWYQRDLKGYMDEYSDVPPPWIYAPNSHPYSIRWRQGSGEQYIMVVWCWWRTTSKTEDEKIAYFRKYPPPPRWLPWMAQAIWDDLDDDYPEEAPPYLERVKNLGFEGTDQFDADLADPKWLDYEG